MPHALVFQIVYNKAYAKKRTFKTKQLHVIGRPDCWLRIGVDLENPATGEFQQVYVVFLGFSADAHLVSKSNIALKKKNYAEYLYPVCKREHRNSAPLLLCQYC